MAKIKAVMSHWDQLIENFQTSSLAFYEAVEQGLQKREVPGFKASRVDFKEAGLLAAKREYLRIVRGKCTFDICAAPFGTGFFFSWWMVEQASPFGPLLLVAFVLFTTMLFNVVLTMGIVMSGLKLGLFLACVGVPVFLLTVGYCARQGYLDIEDMILATPLVRILYERIFKPPTYYLVDTELMFQKAVHNAVLEVIDQVTAANGVRMLSETERTPVLKSFAQSA